MVNRLTLLILLTPLGCTRGDFAQVTAYGSRAEVTCYSGGHVIYHGTSTGKVSSEDRSDGWYFQEAESHNLIRISGTCVVRN